MNTEQSGLRWYQSRHVVRPLVVARLDQAVAGTGAADESQRPAQERGQAVWSHSSAAASALAANSIAQPSVHFSCLDQSEVANCKIWSSLAAEPPINQGSLAMQDMEESSRRLLTNVYYGAATR